MTQKKTSERAFELACALIDEFRRRRPADDAERAIWWQLLDAGMSIGANVSESGAAESGRDFAHKFHIALKEGRETLFWLRLLRYTSPDRAARVNVLYDRCDEIVAILVTSLKTVKTNEVRRKNSDPLTKKAPDAPRSPRRRSNALRFEVAD